MQHSILLTGAGALLGLANVAAGQTINIASAGNASQSTNYAATTFQARLAIDGNITTNATSMSHTGNTMDSWWQVEFAADCNIHELRFHNRADCCGNRLGNFRVSIFDGATEVFGENAYVGSGSVPQGGVHVVVPPVGTRGDRVRIGFLGLNNVNNGWLHLREVEVISDVIGQPFCNPANPTSLGAPSTMHAFGSDHAGGNVLALVAAGVPPNATGYFLSSMSTGSVMPPGSQGILCLSGNIGRFISPVLMVSPHGRTLGRFIDTLALPGNPPAAALPGQTWYFQAWFRDQVGGIATSNFSDAVAITFM